MALKLSTTLADAKLAAVRTQCNSGFIRIYSGTEPATADTALSGNTLLAELTFGATSFGAAGASGNDRVMSANTIGAEDAALADGTATFFRAIQSGGTTVVFQGKVGVTGDATAQLTLTSTNIVQTGVVSISSMTYTQPVT